MNNSKLETMAGGALLISGAIYVRIENNPLLDPNCTHVLAYYGHNRIIRGNRLNCGCELDGIALTNITIDAVEDNCAAIFGALYIFGPYTPSPETLTRKFGNASVVYGTNNLERFIRIEKNGRLQRLGWHKLKRVISASIQIAANPNLCVTIPELEGILEPWTVYRAEAKHSSSLIFDKNKHDKALLVFACKNGLHSSTF
ncbi:hypothetical protein ANCCEY_02660 [Ancylostoma ceylanicum]|uniref:Receptor L-domain domain-containing protein n=1 Tax=Ancylostoma ceylanicum TaxID=53326 RepID=A0A0D6M791_9BILA|nr:hypothetical protein ANCCEY_02660 [Ancylostoma ceylanicum]